MYDKTVRRRRAALALLVGLSVALLTAYFGETAGGTLHGAQRGVLQVLAPIQEGASRALKPFRDLAGWVGDTLDAKGERDRLLKENRALRGQAVLAEAATRQNQELRRALDFSESFGLDRSALVTTRVIGRNPSLWFTRITIDKGRDAGIRRDQPVVSGDGLVGTVTAVAPDSAVVTLITDHSAALAAKVNRSGAPGIVQTTVGKPNDLQLDFVPGRGAIVKGDAIVTAGTASRRVPSLFPPDIPVGRVTRVEGLDQDRVVHVEPYADLGRLEFVQVYTGPVDQPRAELP